MSVHIHIRVHILINTYLSICVNYQVKQNEYDEICFHHHLRINKCEYTHTHTQKKVINGKQKKK